MEIKGVHGGRQSFESVFTWTMVQFQEPSTNLVRLTKAFNDAMVSIGLEPLTDFQLSMVIAFENHCPAQIGKFNSIFIGMPGMYMKEYDQALECAEQIINGSRFLNGPLPELGSKERSGIISATIKLYTNQCSKIEGDLPDDQLVEWHEWAVAYLAADGKNRKKMRLKRFQPYGWWNEVL